jgi:hypothetical protein
MEETKEITKYQWKKGEDFGKIVEIKSKNNLMTFFTDGTQILNDVIDEFLEEMEGEEEPLPGGMATYTASQEDISDKLSKDNTNISINKSKVQEKVPELTKNTKVTDNSVSPLDTLITKLSKKNVEPVEAKLNINLPKKNVFKMLLENGDETKEDLIEAVVTNAVKQIEINKLQEFLITETSNFIRKYYER